MNLALRPAYSNHQRRATRLLTYTTSDIYYDCQYTATARVQHTVTCTLLEYSNQQYTMTRPPTYASVQRTSLQRTVTRRDYQNSNWQHTRTWSPAYGNTQRTSQPVYSLLWCDMTARVQQLAACKCTAYSQSAAADSIQQHDHLHTPAYSIHARVQWTASLQQCDY